MKRNSIKKSIVASALAGVLATSAIIPTVAMAAPKTRIGNNGNKEVKNVILMIADGWSYNQIDATNYFKNGKLGSQVYENFPTKVGMSTYSVSAGGYDSETAWNNANYIKNKPTDSAAAGTAMSTGHKTYDAGIGVDANGKSVRNISEDFEAQGKSTGVITSVEFSHATPAAFVAHNTSRNNYEAIANEMLKDSATDVIMSAGHPDFNDNGDLRTNMNYKYVGGVDTWNGVKNGILPVADANGDGTPDQWNLIETKEAFQALQDGETPDRVLGIAQAATTLQQNRSGDKKAGTFEVPFNDNVPTLAEMTNGALNVLDNNEKGFFLMIEGGAIDWAGHANQSGRNIEEMSDFNTAVEAVNQWVQENSNWGETLLIVTGDHETGYLSSSKGALTPIQKTAAGMMPKMVWNSGDHTNQLVPLFAKGDSANLFKKAADELDSVRGRYIDNIEIAHIIREAINAK